MASVAAAAGFQRVAYLAGGLSTLSQQSQQHGMVRALLCTISAPWTASQTTDIAAVQ